MSWRSGWLEENAPFRKVEVRQSADPQLTQMAGVCLAATSRWAKEMVKDDRRLDSHVVKQLVATANQHRASLGLSKHSSIFGPKLRQIQASFSLTRVWTEVFRRAKIDVAKSTKPKSVKYAVIEFAKTILDEGKAIFLLSFKTKSGRHIIGLHGNCQDRQFGVFDSNVGIYRYSDLTAFAKSLENLLIDYNYYSTASPLTMLKVETKK